MLRAAFCAVTWAFVFVAAAYDSYFAWCYREALQGWELNPLVRWAAAGVGIWGVLALKYAGLVFAAGMTAYCLRRRPRLAAPLTVCVALAYGLLSLHYLVNSWEADRPNPAAARRLAESRGTLLGH